MCGRNTEARTGPFSREGAPLLCLVLPPWLWQGCKHSKTKNNPAHEVFAIGFSRTPAISAGFFESLKLSFNNTDIWAQRTLMNVLDSSGVLPELAEY